MISELNEKFSLGSEILGETNEKAFIGLFGAILKMRNILTSFDEFAGNSILSDRDLQDHQSRYLDLYQKWRRIGVGTAIGKILPPVPLFGAGANNRQAKQQTIVEKLSKFFEKYLGLI